MLVIKATMLGETRPYKVAAELERSACPVLRQLAPRRPVLDPLMRDIEAFFDSTQQHVTAKYQLRFNPYRYQINGIHSDFDLMSSRSEDTVK